MAAIVAVLQAGRDRIEQGWCKGAFARGKTGREVEMAGRAAVAWCVLGATYGDFPAWDQLAKAAEVSVNQLARWNDAPTRTQQDVVDLYDRAIELAEKDER